MVAKKETAVKKPKKAVAKKAPAVGPSKKDPTIPYFIGVFRIEGNPLYRCTLLNKKELNFEAGKPQPVITDIVWYSIDKVTGELSKE